MILLSIKRGDQNHITLKKLFRFAKAAKISIKTLGKLGVIKNWEKWKAFFARGQTERKAYYRGTPKYGVSQKELRDKMLTVTNSRLARDIILGENETRDEDDIDAGHIIPFRETFDNRLINVLPMSSTMNTALFIAKGEKSKEKAEKFANIVNTSPIHPRHIEIIDKNDEKFDIKWKTIGKKELKERIDAFTAKDKERAEIAKKWMNNCLHHPFQATKVCKKKEGWGLVVREKPKLNRLKKHSPKKDESKG